MTADDIEAIVRRVLDKRSEKNRFSKKKGKSGSPIPLLEKELKLNPSQKLRIEEYYNARRDAWIELKTGTLWSEDPKAFRAQWEEVGVRYEELVKAQLTYEQGQRYEELRSTGRLGNWYSGRGK